MAHTTKFEDYLNKLLKSMDEDKVVQEFSFIATENKIRQQNRIGILGTLIRKRMSTHFLKWKTDTGGANYDRICYSASCSRSLLPMGRTTPEGKPIHEMGFNFSLCVSDNLLYIYPVLNK